MLLGFSFGKSALYKKVINDFKNIDIHFEYSLVWTFESLHVFVQSVILFISVKNAMQSTLSRLILFVLYHISLCDTRFCGQFVRIGPNRVPVYCFWKLKPFDAAGNCIPRGAARKMVKTCGKRIQFFNKVTQDNPKGLLTYSF